MFGIQEIDKSPCLTRDLDVIETLVCLISVCGLADVDAWSILFDSHPFCLWFVYSFVRVFISVIWLLLPYPVLTPTKKWKWKMNKRKGLQSGPLDGLLEKWKEQSHSKSHVRSGRERRFRPARDCHLRGSGPSDAVPGRSPAHRPHRSSRCWPQRTETAPHRPRPRLIPHNNSMWEEDQNISLSKNSRVDTLTQLLFDIFDI